MVDELSQIGLQSVPKHIAFIMDGNGRWAKARNLPRIEGHRAGAETVRLVVEECRRLGVRYVTLYAFSTENWKRPPEEVAALMTLLCHHLSSELEQLQEHQIRLRFVGNPERLPQEVQDSLDRIQDLTKENRALDLVLAISYGGRQEIVDATQAIARRVQSGEVDPESIDELLIRAHLYAPDVPDPDLMIRTSNECRISNFLLWQLAYSEIVLSQKAWPEFDRGEFYRCLTKYGQRVRRFGCTDDQLSTEKKREVTNLFAVAGSTRGGETGGVHDSSQEEREDLFSPPLKMSGNLDR